MANLLTNKDIVVRSFKKCGISIASDGSEDFEINLKGIEDYRIDSDTDQDTDSDEDPFLTDSDEDDDESCED